jgi:hypothetical protein
MWRARQTEAQQAWIAAQADKRQIAMSPEPEAKTAPQSVSGHPTTEVAA